MLLIATFMLTVGVALCGPAPAGPAMAGMAMMGTTMMPDNPPQAICCSPDKWQATILDLKDKDGLTRSTVYAVDQVNQIEGYYVVPMGSSSPMYQSFTDHKTMMRYTVTMAGTDPSKYVCKQEKVTRPFIGNCHSNITIQATTNINYVGESSVGPTTNQVKFDVWTFTVYDLDLVMAFSKNGCIPLLENVRPNQASTQQQFEMLFLFNDVSTTLTNPELLTMPAACIGSSVVG